MKSRRKRHSFKPFIIKRNPGRLHRFQQKRKRIKERISHFKRKQAARLEAHQVNRTVNKIAFQLSHLKSEMVKESAPRLRKNWWTPVWNGLVMDEGGKHYKTIRQAIWLYLFLLSAANRRTGILYRKLSTIAEETGFHRRSIERWLRTLRDKGYIETHSTGRALQISVSKWKPITAKKKSESHSQPSHN